MFWKKNKAPKEDLEGIAPLILNSQSQMSGDFIIHTDVKIDGSVEGNVMTTKSVIIGENGHLKGNLKCKTLIVYGSFEGASEVEESARLLASSDYRGKLNTPIVSILPGSQVNARINVPDDGLDHSIGAPGPDELRTKELPETTEGNGRPGLKDTPPSTPGSFLFKNL